MCVLTLHCLQASPESTRSQLRLLHAQTVAQESTGIVQKSTDLRKVVLSAQSVTLGSTRATAAQRAARVKLPQVTFVLQARLHLRVHFAPPTSPAPAATQAERPGLSSFRASSGPWSAVAGSTSSMQ